MASAYAGNVGRPRAASGMARRVGVAFAASVARRDCSARPPRRVQRRPRRPVSPCSFPHPRFDSSLWRSWGSARRSHTPATQARSASIPGLGQAPCTDAIAPPHRGGPAGTRKAHLVGFSPSEHYVPSARAAGRRSRAVAMSCHMTCSTDFGGVRRPSRAVGRQVTVDPR
jgi:hypothetical protein